MKWDYYRKRMPLAVFAKLFGADRKGAGPTDEGRASPRNEGVEEVADMQEHRSTARRTVSTSLRKLLTPIPE